MSLPIPISQLFTPASRAAWLAKLIANAGVLGLATTSWQSGGEALTIIQLCSNMFAVEDAVVSGLAQAGFLDYAATGTVTYVTPDGVTVTSPVTPDPSIPAQNPTGALGWLDELANSVYNVQRIGAVAASGLIAIANASLNTYGPFSAGQYHVANPATAASYSNAQALTINPGTFAGAGISAASNTTPIQITTNSPHGLSTGQVVLIAGVLGNLAANGFWVVTVTSSTQFTLNGSSGSGGYTSGGTVLICQTATFGADVSGPNGSSGVGQIDQAVTSAQGVSVSNPVAFFGAPWESNTALAARCRAKIQSLSPAGPQGAYLYFALSAYQLLQQGLGLPGITTPIILSAPVTRVLKIVSSTTGVVSVIVANASGPVPGAAQLAITAATFATPIQITTSIAHGLGIGQTANAIITSVLGNTAANGVWTVTSTGTNTLTLGGSAGNASYTGGGVLELGDLGTIDAVIQANAVPDSVTEVTISANEWDVTIVGTVLVPQSQVAAYTSAVQTALALYFAALPIGGATPGTLQYNDLIGVLFAAGVVNGQPSYVLSIPSLTVNGVAGNASYPGSTYVAKLSPAPAILVQGV